MAHPVSGDIPGNLARAKRWLAWLFTALPPDVVVIAPWIHDLECLPLQDADPAPRERSLKRCTAVVSRCDAVVLVGGRTSAGMALEALAAAEVHDLTHFGEEPPA